jgi:hypothetical protein
MRWAGQADNQIERTLFINVRNILNTTMLFFVKQAQLYWLQVKKWVITSNLFQGQLPPESIPVSSPFRNPS